MKSNNYLFLIKCLHVEMIGENNKFTWDRLFRRYFRNHNSRYLFWWRIASYYYNKGGVRNNRKGYRINRRLISKYGIEIELGAHIEPGITFAHLQGIVISRSCVIGKNMHIRQNTTIGIKSKKESVIKVGDNVEIGANACIIGDDISIGDNVTIGAMAFVNSDIPSNTVVYTQHVTNIIYKNDTCAP